MAARAIIGGGSIGGLFAAAALRRAGWEVDVCERASAELSGRGAGIVTHPALVEALEGVGAETHDLGVAVEERVAFDRQGGRVKAMEFPQIVTSWDRVHRLLRPLVPEGRYHLGRVIAGYEEAGERVIVRFEDGSREEADLVVGADGFRSAVRGQFQPDVAPTYAGYVVWRALAAEAELPEEVRASVFPAFGFFAPAGTQIIGYPIAGPGNDLSPGNRRYNFVWYSPADARKLDAMLTDATGHRHRVTIPPPLIRDEVLAQMREEAEAWLPLPFVEILEVSERPFFTPIYDHCVEVMGAGRVALAGDAACVARPHMGMGVTKAACDALALARHLGAGADVAQGLAGYSAERVPASRLAHERAQELGSYIFGNPRETNPDGRTNPRLEEIMRTTAVAI